jgi:hypothetical protein
LLVTSVRRRPVALTSGGSPIWEATAAAHGNGPKDPSSDRVYDFTGPDLPKRSESVAAASSSALALGYPT